VVLVIQTSEEKHGGTYLDVMGLGDFLCNTELLVFCSAELFIYSNKIQADGQKVYDIYWSCNQQEICKCSGFSLFCLSFKNDEISVMQSLEKDNGG